MKRISRNEQILKCNPKGLIFRARPPDLSAEGRLAERGKSDESAESAYIGSGKKNDGFVLKWFCLHA
jgi:hypothetical protein